MLLAFVVCCCFNSIRLIDVLLFLILSGANPLTKKCLEYDIKKMASHEFTYCLSLSNRCLFAFVIELGSDVW